MKFWNFLSISSSINNTKKKARPTLFKELASCNSVYNVVIALSQNTKAFYQA